MRKLLLIFLFFISIASFGQALSEDFENTTFPPTGWAVENVSGPSITWVRTTNPGLVYNGSLGTAYLNRENVTDGTLAEDWLITSQFLVPANGELRFWTRDVQTAPYNTIYTVRVTTDPTQNNLGTYTTVATYSEAADQSTNNENEIYIDYRQKVVDLSAYAPGTPIYVAFVMEGDAIVGGVTDADRWLIDDVFVDEQCLAPTALTAGSIGDTSADLSWGNPSGATEWEIEYFLTGFTPGTGTMVTGVTQNPYNLGGLVAGTTYDYYVRAVCDNGFYSDWSGPYTFTTGLCPVTQQCIFNFVMTDSGGNGWQGNTMTISQNGVDVATIGSTFTSGSGPVTVGVPLCQGQPYQLFWNAGGTNPTQVGIEIINPNLGGASEFIHAAPGTNLQNSVLFNGVANCTPPTCPQPTNILITGVNSDSGTITWSDNTGGAAVPATQWNVIIQPAPGTYPTSTTPITATVNTTSYSFSGLNSDTLYEVYIQAVCDAANPTPDPSNWGGPQSFQTTKDYCGGDLFTDSGGASGNYTNSENTTWTICPDNVGVDVAMVVFNSFALENNFDFLSVWDGSDTDPANSTLLGTFTGANLPPQMIATLANGGCLTFNFTSDTSVTQAGWDATILCTTAPTCSTPNGLQVVLVNDTDVTLTWNDTNVPPATNWNIVVQPVVDGYPTSTTPFYNANTNPFTVTGLTPNTQYEFYVQSDCAGDDSDVSFWAGPFAFNTLFAGCNGSAPAGNDCPTAAPICNLDGYCGNTSGTYSVNTWSELSTAFCGSIENNSFLTFEAASTSISMNVDIGNCTNGSGIQFMIFSAANCGSGPVSTINCYGNMQPPGVPSLTFTGLTIGQTYYLMIDGFAGAICDYSITVTSGGSTTTDVDIVQEDQSMCMGDSLTLDVTGGDGVFNWSPSIGLDTLSGPQVVFTPPAPGVYIINVETPNTGTICATADSIEITVYDSTQPSFSNPGPLCQGSPNVPLDTVDGNGISGTWTLVGNPVTEVDASTQGIYDYIFTPDATLFPCAGPFTMQVEILAACTFNAFASAVYVDNCETTNPGEYFNTTGSSINNFGAASNSFVNNDFGTYLQNSGNFMLQGAAVKTFKTTSSNVCGANMYYRVYEASTAPGAFVTVPLAFIEDCGAGTFTSGAPCVPGDQIWGNLSETIDLTTYAPGDYVLEIYYDVNGDNDDPAQCDDTILVNNNGNNFLSTFSIQSQPTFAQTNEECGSSNATITISGFVPGDNYNVTYNDNTAPVAGQLYQANFNGEIVILNLDAGTYDNFVFEINGCQITAADQIVITDFSPSITQVTNNSPICFGNDAVFTIEGTPDFDVSYSVNGVAGTPVTIDASGFATITVPVPAVGTVDLTLLNIYNNFCNIALTNTSSVIVNPLPTATIVAPSPFACIGNDALFTISGTPGATVNYTINGAPGSPIVLDATGNYPLSVPSTIDVQVILVDITDGTTGCVAPISGQIGNVAIVDVPEATFNVTEPTCSTPTGIVEVTAPLISQLNYPGDLFISEITDAQPGSLTYVEVYNGTGADVDLSGYKLKVYTNGNAAAVCDLPLSGILVNNDVVVIKLSSSANEGGVTPDLSFTTCSGVNNNDRITLNTIADVELDVWGTPDGTPFTPSGGIGYNYQRIAIGTTLPSVNWDPADWNATDWGNPTSTNGDYSNVGAYTLFVASYEYTLSDGTNSTTQSTTTFDPVNPGNYTLVVYDNVTNCYSDPVNVVVSTPTGATPSTFDPVTLCEGDLANLALPTNSLEGTPGTWTFGGTPVTDIDTSTVGTFTYDFTPDVGQCASAGTLSVTITAAPAVTFTPISLCEGDTNNALPTSSYTGTWDAANIDTSTVGTFTYTFTPDAGQCVSAGTLSVTITAAPAVTFTPISLCEGDTNNALPTSTYTGSWDAANIDTSMSGTYTYTFTPDAGQCASVGTLTVTITAATPITFAPITLCEGDTNNVLPTSTYTGSWDAANIDTSTAGTFTYTFTPDSGQCASAGTLTVNITSKIDVTFAPVEACAGSEINFPTISEEGYTLTGTWSPATISTSQAATYTFTPNDICYGEGTFEVMLNGCTIPKGFSPNGDGNNDTWDLSSFNVSKVEVFNRYGLKVYSKSNYTDEWNGDSDSGDELPSGTYYYMIEFNDMPAQTGWVYINRGN